ncbi:unnamed protein product [Hydatigera taeniaeformis]|uniref:Uncharacterized protein n=1 Tax=Hydatigena taeniaeformis TaxID=6205 RepID=A0A0R3XB49_HYDTA|nr:unnamed protein product [Hydatigera taeniaeformis]
MQLREYTRDNDSNLTQALKRLVQVHSPLLKRDHVLCSLSLSLSLVALGHAESNVEQEIGIVIWSMDDGLREECEHQSCGGIAEDPRCCRSGLVMLRPSASVSAAVDGQCASSLAVANVGRDGADGGERMEEPSSSASPLLLHAMPVAAAALTVIV